MQRVILAVNFVKYNVLDIESCKKLIDIFKSYPDLYSSNFDNRFLNLYFSSSKGLSICKLSNYDTNFLFDVYKKIYDHILAIDQDCSIEYAQIVEWRKYSTMDWHTDKSHREWTSVIYLNDDYTGGETIIEDTKILPETGKIVTFKGNEILHKVNVVTHGIRYTLPVWYTKFKTQQEINGLSAENT